MVDGNQQNRTELAGCRQKKNGNITHCFKRNVITNLKK